MAGARSSPLRKVSIDPGGEFEDLVRREDGLVRYWMFLNGGSVRLFVARVRLCSVFFGDSYLFWELHRVFGKVWLPRWRCSVLVAWAAGGAARLLRCEKKTEILAAIILWLFVLIFFGTAILVPWWRDHLR
jgi:hypothetical protein